MDEQETRLILWGPDGSADAGRDIAMSRPCSCGCGSRDGFDEGVGNLSGSDDDGRGFTLFVYDEDVFQHLTAIFGER